MPGFTAVAVLALALGIGANTAIFSVVNAVFLRPLPYADAGQLVEICETSGNGTMSVSYPNYLDWKKQADAFTNMAASMVYDSTLEANGNLERTPTGYVSADFFRVFGTRPLFGRDFRPEDDREGAAPTAILSHRLWETRFGSNRAILGTTISVNKQPYTVIGVLPAEFRFYRTAEVFIPISDAVARMFLNMRQNHNNVYVVARLKQRDGLENARVQMSTISRRLAQAYPDGNTGVGSKVETVREQVAGDARRPVFMLLGAVSLVLLIACVNVANLLLARAADRKKEMALRAALGASRRHILGQLLAESVMLALAGGLLGTLFARWSFAGLIRLVPASIAAGGLSLDLRVLGFTLLTALATGVLFGLAPAADALRLNLSESMRDGTRSTGASSRGRLRDALVVSEIALALVLLVGAGLLIRTLNSLMNVQLGFATENILTARVSLPDSDALTSDQASAFFEGLLERVQAMPGVRSAGGISHMPLSSSFSSAVFYRDDRPVPPRGQLPSGEQRAASPEYFRTLGIPVLKGRLFTAADGRIGSFRRAEALQFLLKSTFTVVINESMARRYWPGEDPVGKAFRFGFPEMHGPLLKIVGVVGDTRDYGPGADMQPTWYFSSYQFPRQNFTYVIRSAGDSAALIASVRRAATELDPSALVSDATTVRQLVSDSVGPQRLNMLLLAIFAGLALLLAVVGIYGVMAYAVNRRRQEIGVRIAMGAASSDILRLVMGKAALLAAVGVAAGSAVALALTRLIAGMLYGVQADDPLTFVAVAAVLFVAAVAAAWAPARRATRISPLTALRCE